MIAVSSSLPGLLTAVIVTMAMMLPFVFVTWRWLRLPALLASSLAPGLLLTAAGLGSVVATATGLRWSWATLAGSLIVIVALLGVLGSVTSRLRPIPEQPNPSQAACSQTVVWFSVLIVLGVGAPLVGMDSELYLQRWDSLFHYSAFQHVQATGDVSSLTLGGLAYGDRRPAFYPAAWHAVAVLLPSSPSEALLGSMVAMCVVGWVLGVGALVRGFTSSTAALYAGTAVAALSTASPLALGIGWGHLPNAVALAASPGLLALLLQLLRLLLRSDELTIVSTANAQSDPPAAGSTSSAEGAEPPSSRNQPVATHALAGIGLASIVSAGIGLAHPNAIIAVGVIAYVWATAAVCDRAIRARGADPRWRRWWRRWWPPAAMIGVGIGGWAATFHPAFSTVVNFDGHVVESLPTALLATAVGSLPLWSGPVTVIATLLAHIGLVAWWRQVPAWLWAMNATTWVIHLDAALGSPLHLGALWYSSSARTSVLLGLSVSVTVGWVASRVARSATLVPWLNCSGGKRFSIAVAVAVITAIPAGLDIAGHTHRVTTVQPIGTSQFVTAEEWNLIEDLPDLLDPHDVVLGSPFSGTASAHGLQGVDVVFPVAGQVLTPSQSEILAAAAQRDLLSACEALTELGVTHLYVDAKPYQYEERYRHLDLAVPAGAELIASADTASLYRLPDCR